MKFSITTASHLSGRTFRAAFTFVCLVIFPFIGGRAYADPISYPAYFQENFNGTNGQGNLYVSGACVSNTQGLGAAQAHCSNTIKAFVYYAGNPVCAFDNYQTLAWADVPTANGPQWQATIQSRPTRITCDETLGWSNYGTAYLEENCPVSAGGGQHGSDLNDDFGNQYINWCLIRYSGQNLTTPGCPSGTLQDPATSECYTFADRNKAKPDPNQAVGEPISAGSGNLYQETTDFVGGGSFPLAIRRSYNSIAANQVSSPIPVDQSFGKGWSSNIGARLSVYRQPYQFVTCTDPNTGIIYIVPWCGVAVESVIGSVTISHADGSESIFTGYFSVLDGQPVSSPLTAQSGATGQLSYSAGAYTYLRNDGYAEIYDSTTGMLTTVQDPHGLQQTYAYTYTLTNNILYLQSLVITDPNGRTLTVTYDTTTGHITSIQNNGGRTYTYHYADSYGNLTSVDYPDDSIVQGGIATVQYLYGDPTYHNALTGIVDEKGALTHAWTYDTSGRANHSVRAPNATTPIDPVSITYDTDANGNVTTAHVTEATGLIRTLTFTNINGTNKLATASAPCLDCGDHSSSISYSFDGSNNLHETVLDFASPTPNETDIVLDTSGREISRTEAANDTSGNSAKRAITTTWNATVGLPATITEKDKNGVTLRTTQYCYNTACDGGASGTVWTKTVTDNSTSVSRTTTLTYSNGRLQLVTVPQNSNSNMNENTAFGYASNGDLNLITDALSHQTHINTYDGNGLPLTIVDPNNVTTTLTYDARQRLLTKQVADTSHKTIYHYDLAGNMDKVTQPNGAYLQYGYSDAHILTSVKDNDGNEIDYTPNAAGDGVVDEKTKDPTGVLKRELQRAYDQFNHLQAVTDGMGKITHYTVDLNGNITTISDPLGHAYTRHYDALNRVYQIDDPVGNSTLLVTNALDQLNFVTSPRGLTTEYDTDAFGDVMRLVSPDTGTTTASFTGTQCAGYDLAGNLICKTNAAGISTLYRYDASNRITHIDNQGDITKNVTYNYDEAGHTNGIGRLTSMVDASGQTDYQYDAWGHVTQKKIKIGTDTYYIYYTYDNAGNVATIRYPRTNTTATFPLVTFKRDHEGRISEVDATGLNNVPYPVATGVTYRPFGPIIGLTYGNGLAESRDYDQAYRLKSINIPAIQSWTFGYYDDSTIQSVTDALNIGPLVHFNQTYVYDGLDRLTQVQSQTSFTYHYDADGNRDQMTSTAGASLTYNYSPSSNQLSSISGTSPATYGYDLLGNVTSDGSNTYNYDVTNRLSSVVNSSNVTIKSYVYNGLGQLVKATAGSSDTLYFYDESGNLLNSPTSAGGDYLWIGNRPIAFAKGGINTSDSQMGFLHLDQLGTVKIITDSTKRIARMKSFTPFGEGTGNYRDSQSILTLGSTFILYSPGQTIDSVTGHNYNYFRDYDPATGRYIESDPIGLKAGVNTYTYVLDNPVNHIDRFGLDLFVEIPPELIPFRGMTPEQYDAQLAQYAKQQMDQTSAEMGTPAGYPIEVQSPFEQFVQSIGDFLGAFFGSNASVRIKQSNCETTPPPRDFTSNACNINGMNVCI